MGLGQSTEGAGCSVKKSGVDSVSDGEPCGGFKQNNPFRFRYWMIFLAAKWKMEAGTGEGDENGTRVSS